MSKTKELSELQFIKFWIGDCSEIKLCPECNGQGAKMTNNLLEKVEMCKSCNYTGRLKE